MKFIVASLLYFSILPLYASEDISTWTNAVVKVRSYPCLTKRPMFQGSGVLVEVEGEIKVITSEHILIHEDSSRICFDIQNDKISTLKAKIQNISYLKGLALLSVKASQNVTKYSVPLSNLDSSHGLNDGPLSALGYPATSPKLQILNSGKLISNDSPRSFLPEVSHMIEASGLAVEYGMSGGVLLSQTGHKEYSFMGILSHQYLKRSEGSTTQISSGSFTAQDIALSIPSEVVSDWVESLNEDKWRRDANAQMKGSEVLTYGPLVFELSHMSEKDLYAIGGADGSGIGGADGSGIGGNSANGLQEKINDLQAVIKISLNSQASSFEKSQTLNDPLLDTWRKWLLRGQKIQIVSLRSPSESRLISFSSLEGMLTLWLRLGMVPVTLTSSAKNEDKEVQKLMTLSNKVMGIIQRQRDLSEDVTIKSWLGILRDSALMTQQGIMSSTELESLFQDEHEEMWMQFYDESFDAAVELESSLRALISHLKSMGL
jgi:hypothetical protein